MHSIGTSIVFAAAYIHILKTILQNLTKTRSLGAFFSGIIIFFLIIVIYMLTSTLLLTFF